MRDQSQARRADDASKEVRTEQLLLLLDQSFPGVFISAGIGVLLVLLLWPAQDHALLLGWLAAVFVSGLSRLFFFFSFRRDPPQSHGPRTREHLFFVVSLLYFATWGVGGLLIMPLDSAVHQAIVLYFLMGLSGAAVAVFSAVRSHQLWAIFLMLGPGLAWLYLQGNLHWIAMAIGGSIFLLSTVRSSRVLAVAMEQNISLKNSLSQAKAHAETLARVDELTGLYNRRAFYEYAEKQVAICHRSAEPLSMLLLDIDHFKQINDRFGHAAGDTALKYVAQCLTGSLRETDVCGRVGGEEFAVLLPSTPLSQAMGVADNLRKCLAITPVELPGQCAPLSVTASFGVSQCEGGVSDLVRSADNALYRAKSEGRDRVAMYCEESDSGRRPAQS